jgi:DNA-directed RNA polymerase subunit E'/Rpb7
MSSPYIKSLLTSKVSLSITAVGKNVKENLTKKILSRIENKCIENGYIKPNSINIISYSSGIVVGDNIDFIIIYECMVCNPVEGVVLSATVKTITKAGVHAVVNDSDGNTPITVFVAREHHHNEEQFSAIRENSSISVKVVGARFELNDPYVYVIASLEV